MSQKADSEHSTTPSDEVGSRRSLTSPTEPRLPETFISRYVHTEQHVHIYHKKMEDIWLITWKKYNNVWRLLSVYGMIKNIRVSGLNAVKNFQALKKVEQAPGSKRIQLQNRVTTSAKLIQELGQVWGHQGLEVASSLQEKPQVETDILWEIGL